jgi:hypothetical protein
MSNFMDGYSTNGQERREAEADARWAHDLNYHRGNFFGHFLGYSVVHHGASTIALMNEYAIDALTLSELGDLIRIALRDPAVREKYAAAIESAAEAYATSAAE